VDQRDVEGDPAQPVVLRLRRPRVHDPAEQRLIVRVTGIELPHRGGDDLRDLVERGPLGALVRRRHLGHPVGVHERVGAVQRVECPHQTLEAAPSQEPGPAHEANLIRWPSLRIRSKTSTVPADPRSVWSSAWSRLAR
jgi:hypothetical protein